MSEDRCGREVGTAGGLGRCRRRRRCRRGCYRRCCHVSASSRRGSTTQTRPQLQPAPPPHFLKYATCVLAPPTLHTSLLPEQPDTGCLPGPAHAPSSTPRPGPRQLPLVRAPGRRASGPGRPNTSLGRLRLRHCGACLLGHSGASRPRSSRVSPPAALRDRSAL